MSDQLIVHHCAPTLAGLKAGSLFSCPCRDAGQLTGELRRLNRALAPRRGGRLPLPCAAGPKTAGGGGVPPRDRAVSELSAPGRAGLHLQRGLSPQVRGLLEGLRQRGRRPAHL